MAFLDPQRTSRPRLVAAAIVVATLYAGGAMSTYVLVEDPAAGAAFFPAAGLTLGVLLLSPPSTWPLWLVAVAIAEIVVDMTHRQPLAVAVGFALANTVEPLLGASVVRRFAHGVPGRHDLAVFFVFGAVCATFCGAVIGATTTTALAEGGTWWTVMANWWLGDAIGVVVVGTLIVAWARPSPYEPVVRPPEMGVLVALAAGVALIPAMVWQHPLIYALLPVLAWSAARGGLRAITLTGAAAAFATDVAVLTGRASDLMVVGTERTRLVLIQIYLGLTLATAAFFAVELVDRRRLEVVARRADQARAEAERHAAHAAEVTRQGLALDAHDIVGHALSVISLQVGAARKVVFADPRVTEQLLGSVEEVCREAFHDLDRALALTELGRSTDPCLARIAELVTSLRDTGMEVTLQYDPHGVDVPEAVDQTAYRVVREALTNVLKHAPGAQVDICIQQGSDDLFVSVSNSLTAAPAPAGLRRGRGLQGMRERVRELRGLVSTEAIGDRFVVWARFPVDRGAT